MPFGRLSHWVRVILPPFLAGVALAARGRWGANALKATRGHKC